MRPLRSVAGLCLLASTCGPQAPPVDTESGTASSTTSGTTSGASETTPTTGATGVTSTVTSSGGSSGAATLTGDASTTGALDLGGGGETCGFGLTPVQGLAAGPAVEGDFDGDGILDLALGLDGEVQLHRGAGDGLSFTTQGQAHSVGNALLAGGDFDGDGDRDVLAYQFFPFEGVRVLSNVGGDLGPEIDTPMMSLFYTLSVSDVDADGDDDFAEGGALPVRVWHADQGTFSEAAQVSVSACYATASAWADFDGDGDLDFAVIGDCNGVLGLPFVTVHLREGGGYMEVLEAAQAESTDTFALVAGDFDGDGKVDIVTHGGRQQPAFELHRGDGDGTFAARVDFPVGPAVRVRRALDFDLDGLADVLADGEGVELHHGTADGFVRCVVGPGSLLAAGDFDGDGALDLLLADGDEVQLARAK